MQSHIELRDITKSFNHVYALKGATLEAYKGEVLAIVGDNGAGKSTIIKILSGVLKPDSGSIRIGDQEYSSLTVEKAIGLGVSTVYQDLSLGNTMDVAANIFLGKEITRFGVLQRKEMHRRSRDLLRHLEIQIPDTEVKVGDLSGGQRQGVAVARLVNRGGHILIFDEPTAAMGIVETDNTLRLIKGLASKDMVVIIICHNLTQVFAIADRIAIMRHGSVLVEKKTDEFSMQEAVALLTSAHTPSQAPDQDGIGEDCRKTAPREETVSC